MRSIRGAAAALALGSILACSGLGLCWSQLALAAHHCCEQESTAAPAKACASPGTYVATSAVIPPSEAASPPAWLVPALSSERRASVPGFVFPVNCAPLVLRI